MNWRAARLALAAFWIGSAVPADIEEISERLSGALQMQRQGGTAGAEQELRTLAAELETELSESPTADLALLLGRTRFYLEDDPGAIEALDVALGLDPGLADAHRYRGLLAMYGRDLELAETSLQRALEIDDSRPDYLLDLGRVLELQGRSESALAAYERASRLDPSDPTPHQSSGVLYAELGEIEKATVSYQAALALRPDDVDLIYNLGQSFQSLRRHEDALERFLRVVTLDPTDWRARAKTIQEYQALGLAEQRNLARLELLDARNKSADPEFAEAAFYCRDQFRFDGRWVLALEYFELQGERPRVFEFKVSEIDSGEQQMTISVGSYDFTTNHLRESGKIGPDERVFHLDAYWPNGGHQTYAFFEEQPSYDSTRQMALKILTGELKPFSGFRPPESAAKD